MITENLKGSAGGRPLLHIPIEPLTERYSEQWFRNFHNEFCNAGFEVTTLSGVPLVEDDIKVGAFLDINSTVHYKMAQLQTISRLFNDGHVKDGTVFFFGDVEFWGLESVRLMAQMNNVKVYITGFLHAASYTIEDAFSIAADYQRYTEVGWIAALDKVFVGSRYHKVAVIERRLKPVHAEHLAERIKVTKNPLFLDEYPKFPGVVKQKKVVLTNRFDKEKRPNETLQLFARLKETFPDWEFVVTTGRKKMRGSEDTAYLQQLDQTGVVTVKAGLTKDQYHRELAEAYMMVSHSIEENYGYCIAEALHYSCMTLLRGGLSHDEFNNWTFSGYDDAFQMAKYLMDNFEDLKGIVPCPDASGMQNIINELKTLGA